MIRLGKISVIGILVGFVTLVATSIVLSLLSLALFADLVAAGSDDVLMTSVGPLSYALCVVAVSTVLGVTVCSKLAQTPSLANALGVAILYGLFSYALSRSPSNLANPYPQWFTVISYLVPFPFAALGHVISKPKEDVASHE